MQNPIFSQNSNFATAVKEKTPSGYPTMPGYDVSDSSSYSESRTQNREETYTRAQDHAQTMGQYYAPERANAQADRLTIDDVLIKTGFVFAILLVASAVSWFFAFNSDKGTLLLTVGVVGGLVLGLMNSFKKEPSPILISEYAVFEGLAIGGISAIFEKIFPGIVASAVLATFVTFLICLFLYKSKIVRVNGTFSKILIIGIVSYLVFAVVSFILSMTGVLGGDGLRGITVFGLPIGVVIGLIAVLLASMSLISDFDFINKGIESGISSKYAWTAAFGLVVTLVWLYMEILRLISYFLDNNN